MSPASKPSVLAAKPLAVPERRQHARYPIHLGVFYRLANRSPPADRLGQTVNMSSQGMLFKAAEDLPIGAGIVLFIAWPVSLGEIPLSLVVHGTVVRSDLRGTAVQFVRHEFRTRSRQTAGG